MSTVSKEAIVDVESGGIGSGRFSGDGEALAPLHESHQRCLLGSSTSYCCAFISFVAILGTIYAICKRWNVVFCILLGVIAFIGLSLLLILQFQAKEMKHDIRVAKCDVGEIKSEVRVISSELREFKSEIKSEANEIKETLTSIDESLKAICGESGQLQSMERRIDEKLAAINGDNGSLQGILHELRKQSPPEDSD